MITMLGKYQESIEWFDRVLSIYPKYEDALWGTRMTKVFNLVGQSQYLNNNCCHKNTWQVQRIY